MQTVYNKEMVRKLLMILSVVVFVFLSLMVVYLRVQPLPHISRVQAENTNQPSQISEK
ncbi:hypothetical protein BH11PAT1_BH11PAT1_6810 [soil metagenome]